MSNEIEQKNLINIESSKDLGEEILEKINKQINFLKNRYDVAIEIEKDNEKDKAEIVIYDINVNNNKISNSSNDEILKITQEEKYYSNN